MLKEHCGVAGVWAVDDAYNYLHDILLGLQHRGQESAGVVIGDFTVLKGMGLVDSVIVPSCFIKGDRGIGHVRYSTVGNSSPRNIQPVVAATQKGMFGIAHNGTIPDADYWKDWLSERGAVFFTDTDTEIFLHLISMAPYHDPKEAVLWALGQIKCAYSLVIYHKNFIAAARDGFGIRPLFWGRLKDGFVVASEDAPLKMIGASDINEVPAGVCIFFDKNGITQTKFSDLPRRLCSFEYIYFARPDSSFFGINIHKSRFNMGKILYKESKLSGDVVVPVLDSGLSGALGFSSASGIPVDIGLMRNRYLGRSFIMPSERTVAVKRKLLPIKEVVEDKSVIVIDDSIVRGTTMSIIVKMLKDVGAKRVSVAICSPPVKFPCFYGIDTARRGELIAKDTDLDELKKFIGADELVYLSVDGLKEAIGTDYLCLACFDGGYPHEKDCYSCVWKRN